MKLLQKPSNPKAQGDKSFNSVPSKVKVYFIFVNKSTKSMLILVTHFSNLNELTNVQKISMKEFRLQHHANLAKYLTNYFISYASLLGKLNRQLDPPQRTMFVVQSTYDRRYRQAKFEYCFAKKCRNKKCFKLFPLYYM